MILIDSNNHSNSSERKLLDVTLEYTLRDDHLSNSVNT